MIAFADLVNSALLLLGIAALVVPLHLQNRQQMREQLKLGRRAWKALKRHEIKCNRRERRWEERWKASKGA